MNSNTNNSDKNNNFPALEEEFFAQHSQPTLEQARSFQLLANQNQEEDEDTYHEEEYEGMYCEDDCCCLRCFEQANGPQICVVPEEEDLLSVMSDMEVVEDYDEDEDEGMVDCDDDCCCFRCCCVPVLSRAPQICFVPDGEELVRDVDLEEEEEEEEDQYLYDLKRRDRYPNKSLKTYHEHDPIPMDISDDEYETIPTDISDNEEDEYMCDHGTNCANQVCYECVWYLEQEALHAKRPVKAVDEDEDEDEECIVNVVIEDTELMEMPNTNDRPHLKYQRQTSCWEQNGEIVYNGNPNGSNLYNVEDDDLSDLPDLIPFDEEYDADLEQYHVDMCELEVTYRNGQNVNNPHDAERVAELRRAIAEYESGRT